MKYLVISIFVLAIIIYLLIIYILHKSECPYESKTYIDSGDDYDCDMSKYHSDGEGERFYDNFRIKKNY